MIDDFLPHLVILTIIVVSVVLALKFKLVEITPLQLSPRRKRALGVSFIVISVIMLLPALGRFLQTNVI